MESLPLSHLYITHETDMKLILAQGRMPQRIVNLNTTTVLQYFLRWANSYYLGHRAVVSTCEDFLRKVRRNSVQWTVIDLYYISAGNCGRNKSRGRLWLRWKDSNKI